MPTDLNSQLTRNDPFSLSLTIQETSGINVNGVIAAGGQNTQVPPQDFVVALIPTNFIPATSLPPICGFPVLPWP